jgi:hypothetical protein
LWGVAVHLVAWWTPPFLSLDLFNYVATARAAAHRYMDAFRPIDQVLPAGDPLLDLMAAQCRGLGTGYLHGFVAVAWGIGKLAGERVRLNLELFRLLALLAIVAAAWLTALAVARPEDRDARARAVALVLLCPAAIVEGTVSGHNDAWLMPAIAGFAAFWVRKRERAAAISLAAGLLIKATALLPLALFVLARLFARFRRLLSLRRILAGGAATTVLAMIAVYALRQQPLIDRMLKELVGAPTDALPRCTRSIECLPRAIFHFPLHLPTASWAIGIAFRAASALWLLYAAFRAAERDQLLRWLAAGLFFFLLLFQSRFQAWYVLLLVPLLPFADERIGRAIRVYCVSAIAYYAVRLPLNCTLTPFWVGSKELCEALIVILPPLVALRLAPLSRNGEPVQRDPEATDEEHTRAMGETEHHSGDGG